MNDSERLRQERLLAYISTRIDRNLQERAISGASFWVIVSAITWLLHDVIDTAWLVAASGSLLPWFAGVVLLVDLVLVFVLVYQWLTALIWDQSGNAPRVIFPEWTGDLFQSLIAYAIALSVFVGVLNATAALMATSGSHSFWVFTGLSVIAGMMLFFGSRFLLVDESPVISLPRTKWPLIILLSLCGIGVYYLVIEVTVVFSEAVLDASLKLVVAWALVLLSVRLAVYRHQGSWLESLERDVIMLELGPQEIINALEEGDYIRDVASWVTFKSAVIQKVLGDLNEQVAAAKQSYRDRTSVDESSSVSLVTGDVLSGMRSIQSQVVKMLEDEADESNRAQLSTLLGQLEEARLSVENMPAFSGEIIDEC